MQQIRTDPTPPSESLLCAGFPPARARSLDDDDVVLVAPFDEELDDAEEEEEHPGSAPDTAEQPPTAEANHVSGHQVMMGRLQSPMHHMHYSHDTELRRINFLHI